MKVVFVSNALSHHQVPFCDEISLAEGVEFTYIATKPISKERLDMGYSDYHKTKGYVLCSYESKENYKKAIRLIDKADFVISGSTPLKMIIGRVIKRKPIFYGSERIFKKKKIGLSNRLYRFITITLASKKNTKLLCASAYATVDFKKFGLNGENAYKWGYFPPIEEEKFYKEENTIIWVGRFIGWKHPELAIKLAENLENTGLNFKLIFVGGGETAELLKEKVKEKRLTERVEFKGYLSNEETRKAIGKAEIMVCTSDFNEGWGAVVNEGMGAGCAVVASHAMGSVPFLIDNGKTGYIFKSGNSDELTEKVVKLLKDKELADKIGSRAEDFIKNEYNGKVAAGRLVKLFKEWQKGNRDFKFDSGVLSKADPLSNDWYK